eukprot:TRINITY_DN1450_c0_g1_i2.p5 TRINITY_DN1450_c0_g1~~TRINITY_DN1450_c0_g1_i2.p5  ORF type:complete len:195 (+),score=66.86 TRINITY_DN1450_c0_g1_i2:1889-2473(+)
MILFLLLYKLLNAFRLYLPLHVMMLTIERASFLLLGYIILIFPIIVAFALVFYTMSGAVLESNSTYLASLLHIFTMAAGKFRYAKLIFANEAFGTLYLIIFYFFALHFIVVMTAAIFIVSFRSTIDIYSYPSDERQDKEWKAKDYVRWALSWLPNRALLQLGLLSPFELGEQKRRKVPIEENKETTAREVFEKK